MYLNITTRSDSRKYLSIVHGYRDENGKVKKKTIKSLGYLDDLEKEFEDPIAHFKAVAKEMDEERRMESTDHTFSIGKQAKLDPGSDNTRNFGYTALSKIYHELGIHNFIRNKQRHNGEEYDANTVLQLLVYLRLISSNEEKSTFDERSLLFEKENYTREDFHHAIMFLYHNKNSLQSWLNEEMLIRHNRSDTLIYYNVHNYCSPSHVIRMGVFTDTNFLPVTYELFPCTSNYSSSYRPNFDEIKSSFRMKRMVTVSDKAIINGDSVWKIINTPTQDGYIFHVPVHSAGRNLKEYVTSESDYEWVGEDYKRKSRITTRPIEVTMRNGEKMTKIIEEKQIVFYSKKYARRAKDNIFDGYIILFTSEINEDDDKIINAYRTLWDLERAFRLTKTQLEIRPASISVHDYIEIHLLKCFAATLVVKLLQKKLDYKYSLNQIEDSISRSLCIHINENLYLFSYYDEVLKDIGGVTGIPFDNKVLSLKDIKTIVAATKK